MQELIQKIETSIKLIRNSKEMAGKFKKDKINNSAQTAIFVTHGLKVL